MNNSLINSVSESRNIAKSKSNIISNQGLVLAISLGIGTAAMTACGGKDFSSAANNNNNGGTNLTGGQPNTGGNPNSGGEIATGGVQNTGGDLPTGGEQNTGGDLPTGGNLPTGGIQNTGGELPTGGTNTGGTGGENTINCNTYPNQDIVLDFMSNIKFVAHECDLNNFPPTCTEKSVTAKEFSEWEIWPMYNTRSDRDYIVQITKHDAAYPGEADIHFDETALVCALEGYYECKDFSSAVRDYYLLQELIQSTDKTPATMESPGHIHVDYPVNADCKSIFITFKKGY